MWLFKLLYLKVLYIGTCTRAPLANGTEKGNGPVLFGFDNVSSIDEKVAKPSLTMESIWGCIVIYYQNI